MAEYPSDSKAQMACLVQICRSLAIAGKQYVKLAQRVQRFPIFKEQFGVPWIFCTLPENIR